MNPEFDLDGVDRLLTTTRSVRRRLDLTRAVEPALIERCLELALQAPTGGNEQRWRFVVVSDAAPRRALAALYRRAFEAYLAPATDAAPVMGSGADNAESARVSAHIASQRKLMASVSFLIEHLAEVPIHIIPCVVGRVQSDASPAWLSSQYGSVYPAVWSLMLALRARGLGSCITAAHLAHEEEAAALLGIPYAEVTQVALLPVAYYLGDGFRPAARRPMDEVVFWNRFDRASMDRHELKR